MIDESHNSERLHAEAEVLRRRLQLLDSANEEPQAASANPSLVNLLLAEKDIRHALLGEVSCRDALAGVCRTLVNSGAFRSAWMMLHHDRQAEQIEQAGFGDVFEAMQRRTEQGYLPPCATRALERPGEVTTESDKDACESCPLDGADGESCRGFYCVARKAGRFGEVVLNVRSHQPTGEALPVKELLEELTGEVATAVDRICACDANRREQEQTRHINAVLQGVRNVNQIICRESDPARLIERACETLVQTRGYYGAWIALTDPGSQAVDHVAQKGLEQWSDALVRHLRNGEWPNCMHQAMQSDRPVIARDPSGLCSGCIMAMAHGDRAAMATALRYEGVCYGAMAVSLPHDLLGDPREGELFEELTTDLGFALHAIEAGRASTRQTQALRETSERLSQILESVSDGFFALDQELKVTYFNRAAERLLGRPAEEVVGRELFEAFPEARGSVFEQEYRRALWQAQPLWFETHFLNPPYANWYEVHVYPYAGGLSVFFQVTTERREAQQKLQASEQHLRTIVRNMPVLLDAFDAEGRIIAWNREAERVTGYCAEEMVGRKDGLEVLYPDDDYRTQMLQEIERAGGSFRGREWTLTARDGTKRHVLWWNTSAQFPIPGWDTWAVGVDVTEQRSAASEKSNLEAQLRQAQKMEVIGRLAGGVAHDFNNLLSPILGYSELGQNLAAGSEPLGSYFQEIKKAAQRSRDLTRQLLAFGRKQMLHLVNIELGEDIRSLRSVLRSVVREDVQIEYHLSERPASVLADPQQVQQILMNLVINAQDAMPEGGKITIETDRVSLDQEYAREHPGIEPGEYGILMVTDNGHGMDSDTLSHIFEPFFTTKPSEQGTGLGLATVYGIIKQHGGEIWVYSEPGQGTTFKVYLPLVESDQAPRRETPFIRASKASGETILVVEDEQVVRRLAADVLQRSGYRVITAADPREAIEKFGDDGVDLLLTDVVMPGMNGKQLYQALNERDPSLRVVYMSGYTGNAIAHHGVLDRGVRFLAKPFTVDSLLSKVAEAIAQDPKRQE
ncbi:MAG: PAS domain S-box protein [Phycisphaerae bacterium]